MEPDVIRMYSSSPPPLEDGAEEDDDEFGDFGGFSGVPNSISFTEFDTPTTFNETRALNATSPPELINNRGVVGFSLSSANGTPSPTSEVSKANGIVPTGHLYSNPAERTVSDTKKVLSNSLDFLGSGHADTCLSIGYNGEGTEVLTNGFAVLEVQGSPNSQNSVNFHRKRTFIEDTDNILAGSPGVNFADFAAFSTAEGQIANEDLNSSTKGSSLWDTACDKEQGTASEDNVRDTNRTGPHTSNFDSVSIPTDEQRGSCSRDWGSHIDADSQQRDIDVAHEHYNPEPICNKKPHALNGVDMPEDGFENVAGCSENDLSVTAEGEVGQSDEKGSETETETETSFGRPLSTDALEEYGDMSTTGSVPSPPLQEEMATPADHSQLAEDDEDFGDFGDTGSFSSQGFAHFDQLEVQQEQGMSNSFAPTHEKAVIEDEDDFGDFDTPKFHTGGTEGENEGKFADLPVSDSFGNFSSAVVSADCEEDAGWNAFGQMDQQVAGDSWASFSDEQNFTPDLGSREEGWHESEATNLNEQTSRTDNQSKVTLSIIGRLERLFQSSFPQMAVPLLEKEVASLKLLLEAPEEKPEQRPEEETCNGCRAVRGGVWIQLQDIHEAFGLRYQWGGSHCNKALLCCLGIDIRNILFTGQKKQPVIVPMYAASLGMLEPTKEPVKPVSAAEMIASIAQVSSVALEGSSCPSDPVQDVLPPVQFDWSSSGLTNPLDASGGSSLLNLDFFGPVEDSGSTSSPSIPGVDPELYELTTAKLDPNSSGNRVVDAFARLMSTMEKTSTSTRKQRKDENLSGEAAKVIASLPDLSFMQAKVLMFPTTLTPLGSQATPD
ncbi:aftiphilin a isoform X2 [Genypterus blacodes]|uniref:aftiphilin a isoform X2 n=1 Tax=Genypterus blacodes TaxID=154954 RepID=UPI003F75D530